MTEELWSQLPQEEGARSISLAQFPSPSVAWIDEAAERDVQLVQEVIGAVRNLRAEMKLDPRKPVAVDFHAPGEDVCVLMQGNLSAVRQLASLSELNFVEAPHNPADGPVRSTSQFDLRIQSVEAVDNPEELPNLQKEKERLEKIIAAQEKQLGDPGFRDKAPAAIVAKLQGTVDERTRELGKILKRIEQIEKGAGTRRPRDVCRLADNTHTTMAPRKTTLSAAGTTEKQIGALLALLSDSPMLVISGEKIAKEIGVTRSTVWRWITRLRELGVRVKGHPNSGYHIEQVPDILVPNLL